MLVLKLKNVNDVRCKMLSSDVEPAGEPAGEPGERCTVVLVRQHQHTRSTNPVKEHLSLIERKQTVSPWRHREAEPDRWLQRNVVQFLVTLPSLLPAPPASEAAILCTRLISAFWRSLCQHEPSFSTPHRRAAANWRGEEKTDDVISFRRWNSRTSERFLLAGSRKKKRHCTSSSNGNKHGCQSARTFKSFIYRGNMKFTVTRFIISPLSPVTPPPPSRHSGGAAGGEVLRSRIEYFPRIPCSPPPCSLKQLQYLILRLRSETFSRMTRRLRGAGRSSEERSWILLQFSCTWDSSVIMWPGDASHHVSHSNTILKQ